MIKYLLLFALLVILSCYTTRPLNRLEIQNLESLNFDSLDLILAHDFSQMRIDVFRQTYEVTDECGSTIENEPYHAIGFDLGNALFLDLNGNLSFRIDQLLAGIDHNTDHIYQVSDHEGGEEKFVRFNSSSVCWGELRRNRLRNVRCREFDLQEDTVGVMSDGRTSYRIVKSRSGISYHQRDREKPQFTVIEDILGNYKVIQGRRTYDFVDNHQEVDLGTWFRITQTRDGKEMEIFTKKRDRTRFQIRMKRDDQKIMMYNEDYYGVKIKIQDGSLICFKGPDPYLDVRKSDRAKFLFEEWEKNLK